MELYLMRHARPEPKSPDIYPDDSQRPLSEQGRNEHRRFARALAGTGHRVDLVVSSPFMRAAETARITAEALGYGGEIVETDILASGFSPDGVLEYLSTLDAHSVLLVGHAPDMDELAGALLSSDGSLQVSFKKGAVMGIHFEGRPARGGGELMLYLRPGEILNLID